MFVLLLLLALFLTCVPAGVWLARLVPVGTTCRRPLISGYALLLGMIGVTLIMRLLSAVGIPFSLTSIGAVSILIALAGIFAPTGWRTPGLPSVPGQPVALPHTRVQRLLFGVCLALLLSRLMALGIEVGTRPLFAWDAQQHWTKQAKVFFELASTAPYVSLDEWLALGGQGVYTNMHPDYVITTPLLQTWTNVALGTWHDSLMNLPWLLMWMALGLIFYAQARIAGIDSTTSMAATYVALSLPYLNVQVALAGYADLFLALCFLAALTAFYNWSQSKNQWQGVLCLLCAACCLMVKNEGFYWLLSFISGWIMVVLGIKRGLLTGGVLLLCLLLVIWLMPENWMVAGHSLQEMSLGYRPQGWHALYLSFLIHDNWHFLSYLVVAAFVLLIWRARELAPTLAPAVAVVVSAVVLYFCLYLFTRYSFGAVRMTSLNRVALQLMPAVAFMTLLIYAGIARGKEEVGSSG